MNFDNLDLNIENYDIYDILNLFNITEDYDSYTLKQVKKVVLKLHPDKCDLDQKFFLFFKKAYQILLKIHQFRNSDKDIKKTNEDDIKNDLSVYFQGKTKSTFQKEFNEIFENVYMKDENEKDGYDNWLKSDNDFIEKEIDAKNTRDKSIQIYDKNTITGVSNSNMNFYNYDSKDAFSNNDIKKVYYEETIIPINEKHILDNKKHFKNISEYNNFRMKEMNDVYNVQDRSQQKNDLDNKHTIEKQNSMNIAYNLMLRQEQYIKKYNNEVSKYLNLKNKI